MDDDCDQWKTLIDLVHSNTDNILEVKDAISKLTRSEIEETYKDGMNLMHHAVLKNRVDVINELFDRDTFRNHSPNTIPYVHMAVALGHLAAVKLLVLELSYFNVTISSKNKDWKKFIDNNVDIADEEMKAKFSDGEEFSAFDVAVLVQQKDCLIELMDERKKSDVVGKDIMKKFWIRTLIKENCPSALPMILNDLDFDALDHGFQDSLVTATPEFLQAILQFNGRKRFQLKNPYHLLYFANRHRCSVFADVLECTKILIQYGWDVKVLNRRATYPLYSALHYLFDSIGSVPKETMIKKLDVGFKYISKLLVAGADPTFDEKANEPSNATQKTEVEVWASSPEHGERPAFSSAVEAMYSVIDSLPYRQYSQIHIVTFLERLTTLYALSGCELKGQRKWLGKMVEKLRPAGLKLLTSLMKFNYDSLYYAFEKALHLLSAKCLEFLLQYAKERNILVKHPNPFHFICEYSAKASWPGNAAECIEILIKHGYDVRKTNAQGTYPLHRLIEHAICHIWAPVENLQEILKCLNLMLNAGASPLFNECVAPPNVHVVSAFEDTLSTNSVPEYTSSAGAFHWFVGRTEDVFYVDKPLLEFIIQSAKLLSKHGLELGGFVQDGDTFLMLIFHHFYGCAKDGCCLDTRLVIVGAMCKTVGTFLSLGADIQAFDEDGRSPFYYFLLHFDLFVSQFDGSYQNENCQLDRLAKLLLNLRPVCQFLDIMEMKELYIAAAQFKNSIMHCSMADLEEPELSKREIDGLTEEISSHLKVRSLYRCCLIKVWRYCGLKLAEVKKLDLPLTVMDDFEAMLCL